jgi:small conductance mechanosensitive channel
MATLVTALADQLRQSLGLDHTLVVKFADKAGSFAVSLVVAAIILVFTLWAAKWAGGLVRKLIARLPNHGHPDLTLQVFVSSLVRYAIIAIGLIAVLQQLGVQTTSIIAVLGAASLAVGLALQGTLSNVAAGVMLLILRPYHVGDFVEIAGKQGHVRALDLFTTELTSLEGPRLVVPNGKVLGEMIVNFSARGKRRFEITMGVDYRADLNKALEVMLECAAKEKRVLSDPPPKAHVTTLGESSVTVSLRAWVLPSDYFETWPAVLKLVKEAFDAQGVSFPYPHQVQVPYEIAHPGQSDPPANDPGKGPS